MLAAAPLVAAACSKPQWCDEEYRKEKQSFRSQEDAARAAEGREAPPEGSAPEPAPAPTPAEPDRAGAAEPGASVVPLPAGVSETAEARPLSVFELEAQGTAIRFLGAFFTHQTARMMREVDELSVFARWDPRDRARPNPLYLGQQMMARLTDVRIAGAGRWLAMTPGERVNAVRIQTAGPRAVGVRTYGARALATWPGVEGGRGGLVVPLSRVNGRWRVTRMPYRLHVRISDLPE
jgi:hypothetical protein